MSGYTIKSKGRAALKGADFACPECGYEEARSVDMRGCDTPELEAAAYEIKCPNCDHEYMEKVWRTAPSVGNGDPRSDKNLKRMQNSLKERFIKKEVDDVRHKHGVNYDDAVRSAAATRIKQEKGIPE